MPLFLNINLHGNSFVHCDSETKAEGVAFYIKESLSFSRRNNIKVELSLLEGMWLQIKTNRGFVFVGVVYRHPTNSTCDSEKFSENFFKIFYELNFEKFPIFVLGDFNIDLTKLGNSNFVTKHVHNMINSPSKCALELPTHITDHSKTLIDHIYVNDFKHFCISFCGLFL